MTVRAAATLFILFALVAHAQGPQPSAPSDDPAPAEGTTATKVASTAQAPADAGAPLDADSKDGASTGTRARSQGFVENRGGGGEMRFHGLDLGLTSYLSSGVYFAPESYTLTMTFWLEPSWRFGAKFFKDTWFEGLSLAARLPIELELTGSDGRFRGTAYTSGSFFNSQEGLAQLAPQVGLVDGTARTPVLLGDLWLSLIQGKTLTIPGVGVTLANSLRLALPTSQASRNTGSLGGLSLGFIFDKGLGPVHLTYVFRPAKYFYSRAVAEQTGATDTAVINGRTETLWRPPSTGVANPSFGFINGLSASVELPQGFSISSSYFLFNIMPFPLGDCAVQGVPQANCSEQPKFGGSQWRNDHWFLASVDWTKGPVSLSLGLSTYRPVNQLDGKLTQPFFESSRNNTTTLYLSFSTSAEQLVDSLAPREKKP